MIYNRAVKRLMTSLVLIVCLMVAGCKRSDIVGRWKVQFDEAALSRPGGEMAQKMADNMYVEFRSDKTFTLSLAFMNAEGTWTQSDRTVNLTPSKGGVQSPFSMTLSDGGKTLTLSSSSGYSAPFTFVRQ